MVAPEVPRLWLLCVRAYTIAWIAGFLVVVAPAGAGAREATLVLVLGAGMSHSDAFAVALAGRVLSLIGDVLVAAVALAAGGRPGPGVPARSRSNATST